MGRQVVLRGIRIALAAVLLAVLATIADAILGQRVGSKAIAWALLVVTLVNVGSRFVGGLRGPGPLTGD